METIPTFKKPVEDKDIWFKRLDVDCRVGLPNAFPDLIYQFDGSDFRFLSNFYDFEITVDGVKYPTSEHYYQAMKPLEDARDCSMEFWRERIRLAKDAYVTKKLGRQAPLRPDWEEVKLRIMKIALIAKFRGTALEDMLLATKNAYLIEGNVWHDNCFGICIMKDCPRGCGKIIGMNYLGKFLMELRAMILKMKDPLHNMG